MSDERQVFVTGLMSAGLPKALSESVVDFFVATFRYLREREEGRAWDRYAASEDQNAIGAAAFADQLLAERRKRFRISG